MKRIPSDNKKESNIDKNQNNKLNKNLPNKNSEVIEDDLPTKEEVYKEKNFINQNRININEEYEENNIIDYDNIDENIKINFPKNHLEPFSRSKFNNNININSNNLNRFNFNNYNNNNFFNKNINNNNININNSNLINRINSRSQSYLDEEGNIIYKNNPNEIISRNQREPQIIKLDSHRIRIGNNEFEDLTKEAREVQNKEAFEKKILGITKQEIPKDTIKKPFMRRVGDFINDHEEGILTFLDGIGCILLYGPSINRTIDRIDRWVDGWGEPGNNIENIDGNDNINNSSIQRRIILEKNKDYETILKFLPIWEVRQNKRSINNNNCVICLSEFQIGERIAALPCLHVFHYDCIKNWLINELSCPVCKFEVTLKSIIGDNNN